jgi:glyoxylase-like metal-dependent hydrolase (beta-lactamase superfamily II)
MYAKAILAIVLVLAASSVSALAQPPAPAAFAPPNPNAALTVMPLSGGAYWIEGGIANTGFVVGDKGVVVIDAQMFAVTAKNAQAAIAKVTPKPIDVMILTHSDPDHINGLGTYPLGLQVIAHPNTKSDMVRALADPKPSFTAPPKGLKDYLPTRLVEAKESMVLDGVRMVLIHTAPAHTDGDLVVFLPAQKVVFAGDLLTPAIGPYPGIHLEKHGSSLGWIKSTKALLALKADTFVAGHGPPLTRGEIRARIKAAETRRAQIAGLVAQHKTLAQVKVILQDQPLVGAAARFPTFTETTFQELTVGPRP